MTGSESEIARQWPYDGPEGRARLTGSLGTKEPVTILEGDAAVLHAARRWAAEAGMVLVDPEDLRAALTSNGVLPDEVYDRLCAAAGMPS